MNKAKIVLLLAASAISTSSFAQIEKGTVFLGGRSNFSFNPSETSNNFGNNKTNSIFFRLSPRAGYYLSKSFAIGLGLDYNYDRGYNMVNALAPTLMYQENESIGNSLNLSILARYNKALSKRFAFFIDGTISTGVFSKTSDYQKLTTGGMTTITTQEINGKVGQSINFDFRPGIVYFISPKFGIEATFASVYGNYTNIKPEAKNGNMSANNFLLGYNLYPAGFGLGVHYYFAPKPKKLVEEEVE